MSFNLHGIRENAIWHTIMSQMLFSQIQGGRLELVSGGSFCQLHLDVLTKC